MTVSYRTTVNGVQIFGNNECHPEWLDFVRSQGVAVDAENCYDGVIRDVMGAIEACERVVLRIDDERRATRESLLTTATNVAARERIERRHPDVFDLREMRRVVDRANDPGEPPMAPRLLDELLSVVEDGYLFIPLALLRACEPDVVRDDGHPTRLNAYRVRDGHEIAVHGG